MPAVATSAESLATTMIAGSSDCPKATRECLRHKVGAGDVDREDRVPLIASGFAQAGPDGAGYAGAPDDDVDAPESNAGPRQRRDHLGLVSHIHQDRVATGQLGGDLGESAVVSIEQGHLGPLSRVRACATARPMPLAAPVATARRVSRPRFIAYSLPAGWILGVRHSSCPENLECGPLPARGDYGCALCFNLAVRRC